VNGHSTSSSPSTTGKKTNPIKSGWRNCKTTATRSGHMMATSSPTIRYSGESGKNLLMLASSTITLKANLPRDGILSTRFTPTTRDNPSRPSRLTSLTAQRNTRGQRFDTAITDDLPEVRLRGGRCRWLQPEPRALVTPGFNYSFDPLRRHQKSELRDDDVYVSVKIIGNRLTSHPRSERYPARID